MKHSFSSTTLLLSFCFLIPLASPFSLMAQVDWDPAIPVAGSSFGNNHPRVTADRAGNPLVLWSEGNDVFLARWNGLSFTMPRKLNPDGITVANADWMGPDIAAHGDTVYVVYKETPEDQANKHIWCRRSTDGGLTFDDPVQVENAGDSKSRFPAVTTDALGHPVIAFMKFNSVFGEARWVVTRSFDWGTTFTPDILASGWSGPASDVCDCCPGTITCSGDRVAVVYRDNNQNIRDSWIGLSNDGGVTFTTGANVDGHNWMLQSCPATGPDGVIVGDTLYATFMNGATGKSIVYHNKTALTDLVTPPSTAVPGSGSGLQQNYSRIASFGSAVALLWRNTANSATGLDLMFTADIHDGFPAFADTLAFSQVVNGDVAVTKDHIHVVWQNNSTGVVNFRTGEYESRVGTKETPSVQKLNCYPNPASDAWTIRLTDANPEAVIRVMDLQGRVVLRLTAGYGPEIHIPCHDLVPGIYLLHVQNGDQGYTGKAVKR